MYVTRGIGVKVRTGGEEYHISCVRTHLYYLFSHFFLMLSCFIRRNFTLPSFKKCLFVRNDYFFYNEINFFCKEISFFYFK